MLERQQSGNSSTRCNTAHPDFPDLICRINRGDHRNRMHRVSTPVGDVEWQMVDTEAEFKRRDSEYFALIGRTVMHGEEVAQVIEYQVLRGPGYLFTLQYADGRHVGSQRGEFFVLPTREEVEAEVRDALDDLCITAYPTTAENDDDDPMDQEGVVGHVAGYVLALLRTTSTKGETQS